jgi:hypothetical protein
MPRFIAVDVGKPRFSGPSTDQISNEIKARLTIPALAEKLFPGWKWGKSCRSPFREDKNPSFSVDENGLRWWDYGTGEGGDVFDFYRVATECTKAEAFRALKEMVYGGSARGATSILRASEPLLEAKKEQFHPKLFPPTATDIDAISSLRSISVKGLQIAVDCGFLHIAILKGKRAFIVTDKTRRNYLARRMDGKLWEFQHAESKAYTLPGSSASWPIGIREAAAFPAIALCEGGPDFLAAFHHAYASEVEDRVAPARLSGATVRITADALPYFEGKRVRIFVHSGPAGRDAAKRWAAQLKGIALKVDGFSFDGLIKDDGLPVTDLNDLNRIDCDSWEAHRFTVEGVMDFVLEGAE